MKKKYILLFLFTCILTRNFGQQTPSFTEYNYNPFIVNSAYTGVVDDIEITLSNIGFGNRNFKGAPSSLAITLNTPLLNEKMGLGVGILRDRIGVTTATQFFASYSYKIFFNDNKYPYWKLYNRSFFSFGLNAGLLDYNQDLLSLNIDNDPNFSQNIDSSLPTIGIGALFGQGNFFAGISAPNVLGRSFFNPDNLKISNPIYIYTGYQIATNSFAEYIVKPSFLFKYEQGAPFQIDFNLSLKIKDMLEVGAGYRTSSAFSALVGLYVSKNLRILYNFSQGFKNVPLGSTHGIILSYKIGKGYKQNR